MRTQWILLVNTLLCAACIGSSEGGAGGGPDEETEALRARASDACWAYCEAFRPCTGEPPWSLEECVAHCETFAGCESDADAYFGCVADELADGCEGLSACDALHETARRCTLRTTSCDDEAPGCACRGTHLSLPTEVSCTTSEGVDGEVIQCACSFQGELIATCEQSGLACALETSCCAQVLFGYE